MLHAIQKWEKHASLLRLHVQRNAKDKEETSIWYVPITECDLCRHIITPQQGKKYLTTLKVTRCTASSQHKNKTMSGIKEINLSKKASGRTVREAMGRKVGKARRRFSAEHIPNWKVGHTWMILEVSKVLRNWVYKYTNILSIFF